MGTATFSANGNYYIDVDAAVQSQNQAGNYSTIYWRVDVVKTWGTGFYGSGSGWCNSNVGQVWNNGALRYDFRNGASTGRWTIASGTFNVGHDANGYANYEVIGSLSLSSLGGATAGSGVKSAPRIPKPPGAPFSLGFRDILPTSLVHQFSGTTDGGSGILGWEIHYGTDPTGNGNKILASGGTSLITGLRPATQYYFWSRGRNGVGWGPFSVRDQAKTLSAARVRIQGEYKNAIPYVKHEGVYKMILPYIKDKNVWKIPG